MREYVKYCPEQHIIKTKEKFVLEVNTNELSLSELEKLVHNFLKEYAGNDMYTDYFTKLCTIFEYQNPYGKVDTILKIMTPYFYADIALGSKLKIEAITNSGLGETYFQVIN